MTTTAVVTGAGRGLGRLIAERLAGRGHQVLCTDVDRLAAQATAVAIGHGAWSAHLDVRDAAANRRIAAEAAARGPVAAWFNNAGVLAAGAAWELSDAEVQRQVDVNVLGVIWGCRAAIEVMRSTGGHIINIASMSSLVPAPGIAVYGATKHAVLGFSTSLAGDLARAALPITVSALCPDVIDTDMVRDVADQEAANILFTTRRLLQPDAVADAAVGLLDRPRLVKALPRYRAALAHTFRAFPALSLRVIDQLRTIGEHNRRRR